jgi:hypothetical protein
VGIGSREETRQFKVMKQLSISPKAERSPKMVRPDFGIRPQGASKFRRNSVNRDSGSSAAGSHGSNDVARHMTWSAINKNGA